MERTKYVAEFKSEAVKQVIDKGHPVVDVATRLGITERVLYSWVNNFKKSGTPQSSDLQALQAEMVKLKAELRRPAPPGAWRCWALRSWRPSSSSYPGSPRYGAFPPTG